MDRIQFIDHREKKILFCDYSHFKEEDMGRVSEMMAEEMKIISEQPEASVLVLTDLSDIFVSRELDHEFSEMVKHNKPYVKKSAVLGIAGVKKNIYNMMMVITRRDIKLFNEKEEALDWLVEE